MNQDLKRALDGITEGVIDTQDRVKAVEKYQTKIMETITDQNTRLEQVEQKLWDPKSAEVIGRIAPSGIRSNEGPGRKGLLFSDHKAEAQRELNAAMNKWWMGLYRGKSALVNEALERMERVTGVVQKVALEGETATEGLELVPIALDADVARMAEDYGAVRAHARHVDMETRTMTVPTLANAFSAAIIAEEASYADSAPSAPFGSGTLTAKKIGGVVTASEEVFADARTDLAMLLTQLVMEKILQEEDTQALEGDGTGENFTGLVSTATQLAAGSTPGTPELLDTLALDPFIDAEALLAASSIGSSANGRYYMHPNTWAAVLKAKTATDENYRVNPTQLDATKKTLLGHGVTLSSQIADQGSGEYYVYFGDFSKMYFGNRQRIGIMVDPYSAKATGQVKVYTWERVGLLATVAAAFVRIEDIDT